jgi:hypothetical protein
MDANRRTRKQRSAARIAVVLLIAAVGAVLAVFWFDLLRSPGQQQANPAGVWTDTDAPAQRP